MTLRTLTFNPELYKLVPVEATVEIVHDLHYFRSEPDGTAYLPFWKHLVDCVPDSLPGVIEHKGEPAGPVELQDNHWYMVRLDDGVGEIEAPAKYKSNVDCWYSYEFSGIPTWQLEVLWAVRQHVTEPSAPAQPVERSSAADERMRHDYPILQQFHTKHALGGKAAPSCLCCGQQTHPITRPISVTHMELPAVVVCQPCKDASATLAQPVERQEVSDADFNLAIGQAFGHDAANAIKAQNAIRAILNKDRGQA